MTASILGLLLLFVARAADGLASLEFGTSRGAPAGNLPKLGACSEQLLELLGNPDFDNFTACVEDRLNSTDASHDGTGAAAYVDCWCAGNVSSFIRAQGCEKNSNWKWLVEVGCEDDCSSVEAQDCAANCPASCFETNSKTIGCRCTDSCTPHLHCLVQEPGNATPKVPVEEVCGASALATSPELHSFQNCIGNAASDSTWGMMSNQFACFCIGDLQKEIHQQRCCEKSNNTLEFLQAGLCTANCSVDCTSTEARECLSTCGRDCTEREKGRPSQACEDTCLKESGRCNKYKVCPAEAATPASSPFPYVCNDGQAPDADSGCCPGIFGGKQCPLLCEVQFKTTFWRPGHRSTRCECNGCPATREETLKFMNETLLDVYEAAAKRQLMYIVVTRNLQGISNDMRALFHQQIQAVRKEIISHGGYLDRMLVEQLHAISVYYFTQLSNEADEELVLAGQRKFFAQPSFGLVWLALISSIIVILTIALGCVLPKTLRHSWGATAQIQDVEEQRPTRMVVGRPITSKEQPSGVVEGVLVQQAHPGSTSA